MDYILATVMDSDVAKVSVVLFVLWSHENLWFLWAGDVSSDSCYRPVGEASQTPAHRNLPVHSAVLWYQHVL